MTKKEKGSTMFSKKNLASIPIEETPHATGSRKLLASKKEVPSDFFEAFTYGYLPTGQIWSMHQHENIVEICLVIKGEGTIKDEQGNKETFAAKDRFVFPPNILYEIENTSDEVAEFYFFRLKAK
jgi:quercetin dioxygenase-like cupin family protein